MIRGFQKHIPVGPASRRFEQAGRLFHLASFALDVLVEMYEMGRLASKFH
jgi:hypothetical protein